MKVQFTAKYLDMKVRVWQRDPLSGGEIYWNGSVEYGGHCCFEDWHPTEQGAKDMSRNQLRYACQHRSLTPPKRLHWVLSVIP